MYRFYVAILIVLHIKETYHVCISLSYGVCISLQKSWIGWYYTKRICTRYILNSRREDDFVVARMRKSGSFLFISYVGRIRINNYPELSVHITEISAQEITN